VSVLLRVRLVGIDPGTERCVLLFRAGQEQLGLWRGGHSGWGLQLRLHPGNRLIGYFRYQKVAVPTYVNSRVMVFVHLVPQMGMEYTSLGYTNTVV
jgi:hypothetical protein